MNIELLEKIKVAIAKEPKQFIMRWFFVHDPSYVPNCGTASCIAGHAVALSEDKNLAQTREHLIEKEIDIEEEAMERLGLIYEQAQKLFFFNQWPEQFQQKASNDVEQAIARIDHFIKTNGEE